MQLLNFTLQHSYHVIIARAWIKSMVQGVDLSKIKIVGYVKI